MMGCDSGGLARAGLHREHSGAVDRLPPQNPIAERLGLAFTPTPENIDEVAKHITDFSLAGIRAEAAERPTSHAFPPLPRPPPLLPLNPPPPPPPSPPPSYLPPPLSPIPLSPPSPPPPSPPLLLLPSPPSPPVSHPFLNDGRIATTAAIPDPFRTPIIRTATINNLSHGATGRNQGDRSHARRRRPLLHDDARRHGRRGPQDRRAAARRRFPRLGAVHRRLEQLLPRAEPQQEERRARSEERPRAPRRCARLDRDGRRADRELPARQPRANWASATSRWRR